MGSDRPHRPRLRRAKIGIFECVEIPAKTPLVFEALADLAATDRVPGRCCIIFAPPKPFPGKARTLNLNQTGIGGGVPPVRNGRGAKPNHVRARGTSASAAAAVSDLLGHAADDSRDDPIVLF